MPDTRVADLTKQNQELSTQLATAQAQAADLKEQLKVAAKPEATVAPVAPAAPAESPELTQLKAELQRAQEKTSQLEGARAMLATKLKEAQTMIATPDSRMWCWKRRRFAKNDRARR